MRVRVHSHELSFADGRVVAPAGVARGSALVGKGEGFLVVLLVLLLVLLLRSRATALLLLLLLGVVACLRGWASLLLLLLLRLLRSRVPVRVLVVLSWRDCLVLRRSGVFDGT